MARLVLTNAYISVGGVDLSDLVASVTLNSTLDVVETTAFSSTAAKTRVAGSSRQFNIARISPGLRNRRS